MITHLRTRYNHMALFWIGAGFGGALHWIKDTWGATWALAIGVPIVIILDRWINGPMNEDREDP